MLETFIGFIFYAMLGLAPEPTVVTSYEEAEACFKAGGAIANIYKGDTVEEALESVESFCVLPPSVEVVGDTGATITIEPNPPADAPEQK